MTGIIISYEKSKIKSFCKKNKSFFVYLLQYDKKCVILYAIKYILSRVT